MSGYAVIALDNPKTRHNVGGIIRAAGIYGAAMIVMSGRRISGLGSLPTDTMRDVRHIPVLQVDDVFDAIPFDCVPVACELLPSSTPLPSYRHPKRAFYIFGAEDATLGARILDRCRDRIVIPTERCMNLACTVNVVLYDRMAKRLVGAERA